MKYLSLLGLLALVACGGAKHTSTAAAKTVCVAVKAPAPEMRPISEDNWSISDLMAPRSDVWSVSLPPWTVSSRMRWRMEAVSFSAPSPVWIIEMPSWALR